MRIERRIENRINKKIMKKIRKKNETRMVEIGIEERIRRIKTRIQWKTKKDLKED